ncbi:DUF2986 domain-containing protein [Enterovibrio sp. ZSDZ35]|uniref:DUF2986 domain-containing protein n=1 Tax=Enterovibrio qingdaonensis TaxID=2899818 RepID=A0ABT5QGG2_9GAMM|nr:DUF2986 domain-containing protein [Enterovibrio sp. ZSDZ35]MDD1780068.1 DUF2986 domain-containing protein [Enterovibrio sp. ZSDZ35]
MNRKKKIISTLKKKEKKKNAKLNPSNKPRYISKAERAKMAEQENVDVQETVSTDVEVSEQDTSAQQ